MQESFGAILFAVGPDGPGIILGDESRSKEAGWLPFKGGALEGETPEQAAVREISEETCGLVAIKEEDIRLDSKFATRHKRYSLALVEVDYDIIDKFDERRRNEIKEERLEKLSIKFFPYPEVLQNPGVHSISKSAILYYKDQLDSMCHITQSSPLGTRARCVGVSVEKAESLIKKKNKSVDFDQTPKKQIRPKKIIARHPDKILDRLSMWRNPQNVAAV